MESSAKHFSKLLCRSVSTRAIGHETTRNDSISDRTRERISVAVYGLRQASYSFDFTRTRTLDDLDDEAVRALGRRSRCSRVGMIRKRKLGNY